MRGPRAAAEVIAMLLNMMVASFSHMYFKQSWDFPQATAFSSETGKLDQLFTGVTTSKYTLNI